MYTTAKDEFMGQFDDIDEIAYSKANQLQLQIVRPKKQLAVPRTVLIHEQPIRCYQEPLVTHQMHEVLNSPAAPKKPFPLPRWPVKEVTLLKQEARRIANITSIFHEDDLRNTVPRVPQPQYLKLQIQSHLPCILRSQMQQGTKT